MFGEVTMASDNEENDIGNEMWHDGIQTLKSVVMEEQVRAWKEDAAEFARNTLFNMKQFVDDADLKWGGIIQKKVCAHLNIEQDEHKSSLFWEEINGQEVVRTAFRRKRQATLTAVKTGFRGKEYGLE